MCLCVYLCVFILIREEEAGLCVSDQTHNLCDSYMLKRWSTCYDLSRTHEEATKDSLLYKGQAGQRSLQKKLQH